MTTSNPHDEFNMFAPTSPEEAAKQSTATQGIDVLVDILKPGTPRHEFEEGDNWMRFVNTCGEPWFVDVTYFEMRAGNKMARVAHQDRLFGDINLLLEVQIGLYQNPETSPCMYRNTNKDGFHFNERHKAYLLAARWENSLSPFGIVAVTRGRSYKGQQKYREAWGDALIKLPAEMTIDPMLPADQTVKPKPRWGAIFDPVHGCLIKCSFTNWGTLEISASFTPSDAKMALGEYQLPNGKPAVYEQDDPSGNYKKGEPMLELPEGSTFRPFPQYVETLRTVPRLKDCFRHLTVEEQMEMVRTFVPAHLLPQAEKIMQEKLAEKRGQRPPKPPAAGLAKPGATTAAPAAATAPAQVQLPVPADEPTRLEDGEKLYLDFVRGLGPNFSLVGEAVVRKLIKLSLVNSSNIKQMASFQPEMLKTLAQAT